MDPPTGPSNGLFNCINRALQGVSPMAPAMGPPKDPSIGSSNVMLVAVWVTYRGSLVSLNSMISSKLNEGNLDLGPFLWAVADVQILVFGPDMVPRMQTEPNNPKQLQASRIGPIWPLGISGSCKHLKVGTAWASAWAMHGSQPGSHTGLNLRTACISS